VENSRGVSKARESVNFCNAITQDGARFMPTRK
jgi:hypothetical protein